MLSTHTNHEKFFDFSHPSVGSAGPADRTHSPEGQLPAEPAGPTNNALPISPRPFGVWYQSENLRAHTCVFADRPLGRHEVKTSGRRGRGLWRAPPAPLQTRQSFLIFPSPLTSTNTRPAAARRVFCFPGRSTPENPPKMRFSQPATGCIIVLLQKSVSSVCSCGMPMRPSARRSWSPRR